MKKILLLTILPILLSACSNSSVQEVNARMDKIAQETPIPKLDIGKHKDFTPFSYDQKSKPDPFNPIKLQSLLAKMNPGSAHGIKPDLDRRREALESFPLDTLKMVGTITQGNQKYALIQMDGKGVMQIKAGNYVGQNYGLVTKVADDQVSIKEIVLDSAGDWTERLTKLELQEAKQ